MADAYLGMPPKEEYTVMCALIEQNAATIEAQAASLASLQEQARRDREYSSSQARQHARLVNLVLAAESRAEQAERALAEARDALLTAARRFELMAAGGVECTNGACPKTGHSEASKAAARAFVAQHGSDSREGK